MMITFQFLNYLGLSWVRVSSHLAFWRVAVMFDNLFDGDDRGGNGLSVREACVSTGFGGKVFMH